MQSSRVAPRSQRRAYALSLAYTLCGYVVSVHLGAWALARISIDPVTSNPVAVICAGMGVIALWPVVLMAWVAR